MHSEWKSVSTESNPWQWRRKYREANNRRRTLSSLTRLNVFSSEGGRFQKESLQDSFQHLWHLWVSITSLHTVESTVISKSYFCAHGTFRGAIVNCDFLIQWNLTLTDGCEHCTKASAGQRATGAYRCKFDTFWATARCARTTRGLAEIIASPPAPDISIMCHPKEPIDAMQIVQKDISENLHIRDVGALCGEIGREDSDAPPQGALVTRGPQIKVATVLFIFQIN